MTQNKLLTGLPKILTLVVMLLNLSISNADELFVVNSQSRTLSKIDTQTDAVNNSFALLGNVPNKVVVDEDYLWVVLSGDNTVKKLSRLNGSSLANIFIGLGSNPWDAVKFEGHLYVSGLFSGKVYKVDANTNSVVATATVGTSPEGMLVHAGKLYVANAGNYLQNYAGSSISIIDLASFSTETTLPLPANPQYLAVHAGKVHVSCTGNWDDIPGSVCIIDPASNEVVHTLALGGTPGCLWMKDDALALVADSGGAMLYSYNPTTYEILNGAANPLPNGGTEIVGTAGYLAILQPNWGGNGIVQLRHPDFSLWKQYSVAMMPTDLKLYTQPSESSDQVEHPHRMNVYPNPLRPSEKLRFSSSESVFGELCLYNLKGQLVFRQLYLGKELVLPELDLPTGLYLYRLQQSGSKAAWITGKFIIQK